MRRYYGPNENLTLTEAELNAYSPVRGEGGRVVRIFCPFHGGDRQRSLRVDLASGRFYCFNCRAWGYMDWARERWRQEHDPPPGPGTARRPGRGAAGAPPAHPGTSARVASPAPRGTGEAEPARPDLAELLEAYQRALPGSPGERYLAQRGIPLELAQRYGVGYAAPGRWAHRGRDWRHGRVVIPHTDPAGRLVNLYGRAVGEDVPKGLKHDHLPGAKGCFNARALAEGDGPLFVTEGPFDALALMAAGYPRTVAIFGVGGWRWDWAREIIELVLALDADQAGQEGWRELARGARLRGKRVWVLPSEAYGGYKDASEAWVAGALDVAGHLWEEWTL